MSQMMRCFPPASVLPVITPMHKTQASPSAIRQYKRQLQTVQKSGQSSVLTTHNTGVITIQQSSNNLAQVITERFGTYQLQTANVYQTEIRTSGNP